MMKCWTRVLSGVGTLGIALGLSLAGCSGAGDGSGDGTVSGRTGKVDGSPGQSEDGREVLNNASPDPSSGDQCMTGLSRTFSFTFGDQASNVPGWHEPPGVTAVCTNKDSLPYYTYLTIFLHRESFKIGPDGAGKHLGSGVATKRLELSRVVNGTIHVRVGVTLAPEDFLHQPYSADTNVNLGVEYNGKLFFAPGKYTWVASLNASPDGEPDTGVAGNNGDGFVAHAPYSAYEEPSGTVPYCFPDPGFHPGDSSVVTGAFPVEFDEQGCIYKDPPPYMPSP